MADTKVGRKVETGKLKKKPVAAVATKAANDDPPSRGSNTSIDLDDMKGKTTEIAPDAVGEDDDNADDTLLNRAANPESRPMCASRTCRCMTVTVLACLFAVGASIIYMFLWINGAAPPNTTYGGTLSFTGVGARDVVSFTLILNETWAQQTFVDYGQNRLRNQVTLKSNGQVVWTEWIDFANKQHYFQRPSDSGCLWIPTTAADDARITSLTGEVTVYGAYAQLDVGEQVTVVARESMPFNASCTQAAIALPSNLNDTGPDHTTDMFPSQYTAWANEIQATIPLALQKLHIATLQTDIIATLERVYQQSIRWIPVLTHELPCRRTSIVNGTTDFIHSGLVWGSCCGGGANCSAAPPDSYSGIHAICAAYDRCGSSCACLSSFVSDLAASTACEGDSYPSSQTADCYAMRYLMAYAAQHVNCYYKGPCGHYLGIRLCALQTECTGQSFGSCKGTATFCANPDLFQCEDCACPFSVSR